ncbi:MULTISPECIES: aKG-HExxH-type peptide beta-hydroxylase [Chromobacterium]|uniref:aKG-HExxH-type peptide beta-hydroxylase n=1 Tax=Chromobacterium TaxID=535 RepID=UPI0002D89668|nr:MULTISPECIES: HEXXH motif-containing putative peptide modification protein [Chromobacterium]
MTPEIARAYSNPFEAFDEDWHAGWTRQLRGRQLNVFLEHWRPLLQRHAPGVAPALSEMAAAMSSADGADAAEAARLTELAAHPFCNLQALRDEEARQPDLLLSRALQCALHWSAHRPGREFHLRLSRPLTLGFAAYALPAAVAYRVSGDAKRLEILLDTAAHTQRGCVFERAGEGWRSVMGPARKLPAVALGETGPEIVLRPLPRCLLSPDPDVVPPGPGCAASLGRAVALIARHSPAYHRWIARLLRVVSPLRLEPGKFNSETYSMLNGALYMTIHPDPLRCAETLVHEVSHDYLHQLAAMGPLSDSSLDETFYSPARGEQRPTLGILKAHHAFVNVLIFYYRLIMAGVAVHSELARNVSELEDWRAQMEDSLDRARALTALGQALWRPLALRADQFRALAGRDAAAHCE